MSEQEPQSLGKLLKFKTGKQSAAVLGNNHEAQRPLHLLVVPEENSTELGAKQQCCFQNKKPGDT